MLLSGVIALMEKFNLTVPALLFYEILCFLIGSLSFCGLIRSVPKVISSFLLD
jgi:hypothetical protein